jgi:hypothetical protein
MSGATTLSTMTLSVMTLSVMTLSVMTLSVMTLSIILSIMAFSITIKNATQHDAIFVMLNSLSYILSVDYAEYYLC